jgi:ATP-binding cassette subfamily B protein/subfamily B ATP-binding cassette protein MsbA
MKLFARALKEAWRHWFKLSLAFGCSLLAAGLWGANIGAIFPLIETTLKGESLQTWNQERIDDDRVEIDHLNAQIADLDKKAAAAVGDQPAQVDLQAQLLRGKLKTAEITFASHQRMQPLLERFLPAKPFATVVLIVSLVLIGTTLKNVLAMTDTLLVTGVAQSIARDMRMRIFNKALVLDRPGFNTLGTSGFSAHIMQTTDMLASGITNFYGGALNEPLRIVACLIGAMIISWRLTLLSLVFAPLSAFSIVWLNRKIRNISRSVINRSHGYHHVMLEVFSSLQTVQAYTMEDYERDRFGGATKQLRHTAILAAYYNALANPLTEIFGIGMLCTALAGAAYLLINHQTTIFGITIATRPLTIPSLTVFFGLMIGAADPLRKMSNVITSINTGMAAANMLYPLLDMQSKIVDPAEPKHVATPHRQIEFREVGFSYDGSHDVLRNVNLKIPFGERLAIIGPNGGGKSTLTNLLCRFFDPQQGEITVDGVSLKDMALADLRGRIALVTQQTELFNETILHNIRYGCWTATDEAVIEAAKQAKAHDFIRGFSEGYQTLVGPNGQRLSGGQRQRIALARAILRNSEILVLDEATSQIDVESESLIHDVLAEFGKGRTMLMVSHRKSTLALATKIVQIDHGVLTVQERPESRAA